MKTIYLYTDGACSGNQYDENVGGWGAILQYGDHKKELYGSASNTTNNIMELTAMIEGLQAINDPLVRVEVFSDSAYIVDCISKKWYINWQNNGWKTSKKTPVENKNLWEALLFQLGRINDVKIYKVKGHLDVTNTKELQKWYEKFIAIKNITLEQYIYLVKMNHAVDALANKGIDEIKAGLL